MPFSITQLRALELTPKVTASLSIPGSLFILVETWLDSRRLGTSPMQRALAGMSVIDVLSSAAWFLSTWAAPKDSGALYASGNQASCRFQGFLLQVAIGAPMYNGALIFYYLLTIKYQWTNEQLIKIEPYVHIIIWLWCIGTSVWVLVLDLLHYIGPVCWVSNPPECLLEDIPDGVDCEKALPYSMAVFCIPVWIFISLTIYALFEIYLSVRKTVQKMSSRTIAGTQVNSLNRSTKNVHAVAIRGLLYSISFVITWTPSTIWNIAQFFDYFPFWISYLWALLEPLQGLWNFCIFCYNRPHSRRKIVSFARRLVCLPPLEDVLLMDDSQSLRNSITRRKSIHNDDSGRRRLSMTAREASYHEESPPEATSENDAAGA